MSIFHHLSAFCDNEFHANLCKQLVEVCPNLNKYRLHFGDTFLNIGRWGAKGNFIIVNTREVYYCDPDFINNVINVVADFEADADYEAKLCS